MSDSDGEKAKKKKKNGLGGKWEFPNKKK